MILRFLIALIFSIKRSDTGVNRKRIWQRHFLCIQGRLFSNSRQVNITPNGTTAFLSAAFLFDLDDECTGLSFHVFSGKKRLRTDHCLSFSALSAEAARHKRGYAKVFLFRVAEHSSKIGLLAGTTLANGMASRRVQNINQQLGCGFDCGDADGVLENGHESGGMRAVK